MSSRERAELPVSKQELLCAPEGIDLRSGNSPRLGVDQKNKRRGKNQRQCSCSRSGSRKRRNEGRNLVASKAFTAKKAVAVTPKPLVKKLTQGFGSQRRQGGDETGQAYISGLSGDHGEHGRDDGADT